MTAPLVSREGFEPSTPGLKVRVPAAATAPPVPSQTLTRLPSLRALYGRGYAWDGRCHRCGSYDWDDEYWDYGWKTTCSVCGWWICQHTVGTDSCHTSDGTGMWRGAPPAGCPTLSQGVVLQTPVAQAASRGAEAPSVTPRAARARGQFSEKQNAAFQALLERQRLRKVQKDSGGGGIASQVSSPDEIPTADFTAAALDVAGPDRAAGYPVEAAHGRAVSRRPLNAPLALKEGAGSRPVPSIAEVTG